MCTDIFSFIFMILILTYDFYEQGTDPVTEWLAYFKHPYIKLCLRDLINDANSFSIHSTTNEVLYNSLNLTKDIGSIFYRRFRVNFNFKLSYNLGYINNRLNAETNSELSHLSELFFYLMKDKHWFPKPSVIEVNKEIVLSIAKSCGLNTPRTLISTSKDDLLKFYARFPIVYKPLNGFSYYTIGEETYSSYVTEINNELLSSLPDKFFPSLFQERIKSEYEIRTFYLDGEFYSSAIVPQKDKFKRYVDIKKNYQSSRWSPYNFPDEFKDKIRNLMNTLNLNTGSIDVLKGVDGKYYFLEVNPVGQYLSPSISCGYCIEKKIAEWLIKKDLNSNH